MSETIVCPKCGGPAVPDSQFQGVYQCPTCRDGIYPLRFRPGPVYPPSPEELEQARAEWQFLDDYDLTNENARQAEEIQARYVRGR